MEVIYDNKTGTQVLQLEKDCFYHDIAKKMSEEEQNLNGRVTVSCDDGRVSYGIRERSGTQCISQLSNSLPGDYMQVDLPSKYLTCVKQEKNSYKFYRLDECVNPDNGKLEFKASWGRMGTNKGELFGQRSCFFPLEMFWIKYFEKIGKGYVDQSDSYITTNDQKKEAETKKDTKDTKTANRIVNKISAKLFGLLKQFSKHAVKKAQVRVPITEPIIKRSEELIKAMYIAKDVDEFNDLLTQNISILQRPVATGNGRGVYNLMAKSPAEFKSIIERESDLLDAMKGVYYGDSYSTHTEEGSFDDYDIEVYEATDKQKEDVLRHLSDQLKPKVVNVYRVIPHKQQKAFNEYLKKNDIKAVKQLWHGSRNENWMSIIINSLSLNPNAIITGKMFGNGIYFAPSSMKSWNYTSFRGTSWARGNSDTAFMGLYAVAYGKPLDVEHHRSYTQAMLDKEGKNCVHAHKGAELLNDEIIFYSEKAMVLNYIVEFH